MRDCRSVQAVGGVRGRGRRWRKRRRISEDKGEKKIWPVIRSQSFTVKPIRLLKEHLRLENSCDVLNHEKNLCEGAVFFLVEMNSVYLIIIHILPG